MPFGQEGLVIAWTGPVPRTARVSVVGGQVFESVSDIMGTPVPESLPEKYLSNRHQGEVFNISTAWNIDEVRRWNERYGMTISEEALALFGEYLDSGDYVIFQSLVEHPYVTDPALYARTCSVVFQRGDIFWSDGREDLFLRSYFHNAARETGDFVNFGPADGLHISFATDTIWYPLRVTKLNEEPTSVVLNILTRESIGGRQLHDSFRLQKTGQMRYGVARYSIVQVSATLEGGVDVPDLSVRIA